MLMKKPPHIALGEKGEQAAAAALRKKGMRILAVNWRPSGPMHGLELDLVAEDGQELVFIEVKTRTVGGKKQEVAPSQVFTGQKQKKVLAAARLFLAEHGWWQRPCRFDFVSVAEAYGTAPHVEHFTHVIEFGNSLDSGNTAWQPW